MPTLPSELTDLILDNLQNDKATLSLCSTLTRRWLPTCQFHLFRQITYRACRSQGNFLPLVTFLRDSDTQHLIDFIDTLILDGTDPEVCHAPIDEQSQNYGISNAQIYDIIASVPSLKTLILRNLSFIRMEDVTPIVRHQFETRNPSGFVVQSLILDSVGYNQHGIVLMTTDEIDKLFSIFTFIGNFCMYDMTFFPQEIAIRHTSPPPSFDHMDTGKGPQGVYADGCSALYLPFRSLEKRDHPKSLTVRCRDVLSVGKFLQTVGCQLEQLDLDLELGLNGQLSTEKLFAFPCIPHNIDLSRCRVDQEVLGLLAMHLIDFSYALDIHVHHPIHHRSRLDASQSHDIFPSGIACRIHYMRRLSE